ncbi:MAG: helix-turn-helix transcriptional regulator [Patescibacteria group bacterium]
MSGWHSARVAYRLRTEKHWNQAELANLAGVGQGQVSNLEKGKKSFNLMTLLKIIKALGLLASEFFLLVEQSQSEEQT